MPPNWLMNPIFLVSLGAFTSLGLLVLSAGYFLMAKRNMPQKEVKICQDCQWHEGVLVRLNLIEKDKDAHVEDYRELRRRVDALERKR